MKRLFIILPVILLLTSCNKKTVLLPETDTKEITEILDVSPIYIFYDETKPDSTDFNRKNMISTTNWLVNIDKRLMLKQILPHLQYLQEKRNKDGMHKNENAKNYFTCFNPEIQNLAFIEFTDLAFHDKSSEKYFSENSIVIDFNTDNEIIILNPNTNKIILKTVTDYLLNSIEEVVTLGNIIYLNFNKNLSFQDYITYKSLLLHLDRNNVTISNDEFIYN
ncbi:hypothetical protein MNBD_BACTEROID02-1917 [hydrothermal vent metagenome]|uniref:Uncharacterized protein n=1 Tax=hydrothermal vent metagenome TaxID=652676 RepID=A0A3B0QS49_9ZZZZ